MNYYPFSTGSKKKKRPTPLKPFYKTINSHVHYKNSQTLYRRALHK
jgi:hypothetical protein